jgi:hypothetical protein
MIGGLANPQDGHLYKCPHRIDAGVIETSNNDRINIRMPRNFGQQPGDTDGNIQKTLNARWGAVRRMRTRIRLLVQPEPMRSIIGATQ